MPSAFRPIVSRLIPGLLALLATLIASQAAAQATLMPGSLVQTPQVRAELVAHAPQGIAAGRSLMLGLLIEHRDGWKTYWKNPGDAGLPTTLQWDLPAGLLPGPILWPTPRKLSLGPLVNYGYGGHLLLAAAVQVGPEFAADALRVKLRADWLACKDICIPESGDFELTLPAGASTALHGAEFAAAERLLPVALAGVQGQARVAADGTHLLMTVRGLPADWRAQALDFFPETPGLIDNAAPIQGRWDGDTWVGEQRLDAQRSLAPAGLPAVLARSDGGAGVALTLAIDGPWPAAAAPPPPLPAVLAGEGQGAATSAPAQGSAPPLGLALALLFAFVGGSLLNLMPCVFPVLSLKVLGFARHADQRGALLAGGLAYSVGVVASFLALAAALLALRAGGEQLGWGFQLQSPAVVAALAAMFTVIGLNLAGVFEFGSMLPSRVATLQARHPVLDSALTGVLAVAVAAPCTAPFMGASLGYAVTLPSGQALAVFAALGLGMAAPYLLASAFPAWARWLPRPGAWMLTFRHLMAFPMFATVVWLVWVLGQQVGLDGAAAVLVVLVVLALAVWALAGHGRTPRGRLGLGGVALALLALTLAWATPMLKPVAAGAPAAAGAPSADGWDPWSAARVATAQAEGRTVFVDFTAAWCVTCQFNKRTTLGDTRVRQAFAERGVLTLRADWTRRDEAIGAEIARLGRSGVPVYALYRPGSATPQLLGEILSVAEVLDALGDS